jgi:DNA-binding NarL/FixJ family response regulator
MTAHKSYKIMLVDDHVVLRDALANLINSFKEFEVMDAASNGQELVQKIKSGLIPDLVVLDINMPLMNGYETAQWLSQKQPGIKIVVLTMFDSEIPLIQLLQKGVRGFLKKDIHPNELHQALVAIAEGGYFYSHNTTGKLAAVFQRSHQSNTSIEKGMINDTEMAFLKLAATDMTYKEIASQLKLSPSTIDNYREMLFAKLEVKSRVGLAIYAVKNGIVNF